MEGHDVSLVVADGLGDEEKDGVKIYDIGKPKNRIVRILHSTKKVNKKAIDVNSSIYHFHDPELLFVGNSLIRKGKKVVFDIHENVGEQIMIKEWLPYPFRKVISWIYNKIESNICRKLSALIVPQPIMVSKFLAYNSNTFLVENFPFFKGDSFNSDKTKRIEKTICFHPGSLMEDRGLINMITTFEHLDSSYELHLAGAIQDEMLERCKKLKGWEKTIFHGEIHFNEVLDLYKKTTIGLILYNNVGQYYLSYAVKLFEYMSYGIPVIMPNFGEWVGFNEENECGINIDPKDSKGIAKAIAFLNDNPDKAAVMGKNGYNAIVNKYNWDNSFSRLTKCYQTIEI
tara:strand:- start:14312 stop:15340 length:1029 start_codon:yes stop_codon:yes gene_type:complete